MPNDNHIKIFIAYSREDKDILDELHKNLTVLERTQDVDVWYDGEIEVGENWEEAIKENLHSANIILLLISQNFIASDYSYNNEMMQALALHQSGKVKVIPVIARECLWQDTPFSVLQPLPPEGKPITSNSWENPNRPYFLVANEIKDQVNRIRKIKKGIPIEAKPEIKIERPEVPVNAPVARSSFLQSKGFKIGVPISLLVLLAFWIGPQLFSGNQNTGKTGLQTEKESELAIAQGIFDFYMEEGREYFFKNNYNNAKSLFEKAVKTGEEFGIKVKEAKQFITKCNDELEKIKKEQTREQILNNYHEWKDKGAKAFALKDYKTALEYFNRAKDFMETEFIKKKIKECEAKLNEGQTPGSISPSRHLLIDPKFRKAIQNTTLDKNAVFDTAAFRNVTKRIN